ncbi:hypothetical protein [Acinetobacter ihumii]|uniref:hypothetical protein n=1 Tax=Acinetobacter ihumii TaxID=2483802 RepID=UPI0013EF1D91|nr:hypothetical protein [Acinetobacter ihumii]
MQKSHSKFPLLTVMMSLLLGGLFLGLFYLAVSHEPEYMPSQQRKQVESQLQH